ncbi:nuclear transport factor 2 family protein [Bradyrhizobium septentrionale]|uniref:Nuclear transport factor 2 family protein n=1 Tax=Bradyrhizobium septentrionale TaxID=1404411 RepID=A0A973W4S6_9BRAD|nr:nuclear transport factor 2 family protein [Bradyrhizobium septentrionale]UGY16285.1 nuclear transport factor 2 family protein [Bradyrhizobium septentrionale]UGY24913.1 nuclear transport factor 2 family protein [Bradyrhizobium septentrionale]
MTKLDKQTLENIGRSWVDGWNKSNADEFAHLFREDGEYLDAAFGALRRGRDFMRLHHQLWHRAISGFRVAPERFIAGDSVVVVQAIGEGTFDGESLGGGKVIATGKAYRARLCAVLAVAEDGKITRCSEYYDRSLMPEGEQAPFRDLDHI